MNNKDIDKLVLMIGNGKNSYRDIHNAFPSLSNYDIYRMSVVCSYYGDVNKLFYLNRKIAIDDYPKYELFDDDTFRLSEEGENRFYELEKEQQTSCSNNMNTVIAIVGIIVSIILAIITVRT